ncbi:sensor histidine kinase [Paenibacillus sp. MBLB4367]|uniref:sensor histidine kinase n=1 Tax=Paenibacillus sp. MBLB4367 TaxID=3384767 RepID=UPI003907FBE3
MIFLTVLFLIFSVLFTYKHLTSVSTRFLYGIMLGWVLSFVSFILYLSKFNYYYNVISRFFDFSPGTWNHLVLVNFNPDVLIRMLNGGVILFQFSFLCYAVSFVKRSKKGKSLYVYALIGLVSAIQLAYYDPSINLLLQDRFGGTSAEGRALFAAVTQTLNTGFQLANYGYLLLAFGLLLNDYFNTPKIKFLKNYALFNILTLVPVAAIHALTFNWAPKVLVKATVMPGYHNYLQPQIGTYTAVFNVFPYVAFAALAFMIAVIVKYSSIETYHRNRDVQISKSIDTASLGVRAFTHALKNHLLAIRSEAEFLKEKHANDNETAYSLELMLDSCAKSFESIDYAADKLKTIELNLQHTVLDAPVRTALARFQASKRQHAQIHFRLSGDIPAVYMDEFHMSEAVFNIVENALESFGDRQDGVIEIEIGQQNGWGVISIRDNGQGVPSEHLDSIFSPFFTTKSSVTNWGIGLSYCHKIVAAHDGDITVESGPQAGTLFKIVLPTI